VQRMIKELTESKMNWRELIRQQVQSTMKHDFTFARPSRKGQQSGAILPGMNFMDRVDIAVGIDMSGSIGTKQATDFMSEIKGIIEEFQDYAIHVWCFDTAVYNDEKFSSEDGRDITEYDIKGGGGTDFDANWEFMKENDITPKKFIMFTDGYPYSSWGDEDYCDTLFIIHGHHDKNLEAPFGMTAHYDENA
jgi:predicted metal-dependent peptidase